MVIVPASPRELESENIPLLNILSEISRCPSLSGYTCSPIGSTGQTRTSSYTLLKTAEHSRSKLLDYRKQMEVGRSEEW